MKGHLVNHSPLRASGFKEYIFTLKFDTNNTSNPDGVDPGYDGVTVTRTGVGDFKITFDEDVKPYEMRFGDASVIGDEPRLDAKVTGYTRSSGELTVTVYQEQDDGTDTDPDNGISVAADTTDKEVRVFCVLTRSSDGI